MIRAIASLATVFVLAGCVTPPGPYTGPSGEVRGAPAPDYRGSAPVDLLVGGCDQMVPIIAGNARDGYARQTAWISRRYPNSRILSQRTSSCGDAKVDIVTVEEQNGQRRELFFDVSSFYGKTERDDLDDLLAK